MAFEDIEARCNRAVATHLSNKTAVFSGGSVRVVFDAVDQELSGLGGNLPRTAREWSLSAPASDFDAVSPAVGAVVAIAGVDYELVSVDKAPSGWVTWKVRRQ